MGMVDEDLIARAEAQILEQSKRIEFYITEYSIELLATKMRNGDFFVPSYQRDFRWEPKRKSRFIESVLMGLPIPFLFFWEDPATGKLEIVDGSQRLRTIEQFIFDDLQLDELDQLSLVSGLRFSDLPESRQRKIKNKSIRGIILSENTDEQSRFDLFERINTGSLIANPAEVRSGAQGGPFLDLVRALSNEPLFNKIAPVSDKQYKEREGEELVTRFFAYSGDLEGYRDRVAPFLYDFTKKMNAYFEKHPEEIENYRQSFLITLEFVERNFPWGFRKSATANSTPRARFEAIAVGSFLAISERPELLNQEVPVEQWLQSDSFAQVTGSDGANAINRLKARIHFVRDNLLRA